MALPVPFVVTEWEKDYYTEDEYFAWEDHSPVRWEFRPVRKLGLSGRPLGVIHAMPGSTADASFIGVSLISALSNVLKEATGIACRVLNCQLKFHTPDGRNTYPDVSVVRGKAAYHRERDDNLTNPILLAEVLTETTEAYDRGDKWASYQTIPTLQHFLLVASEQVRVEVYTRTDSGWHLDVYADMTAQVPLSALGVTLALTDVYEQVDFEQKA